MSQTIVLDDARGPADRTSSRPPRSCAWATRSSRPRTADFEAAAGSRSGRATYANICYTSGTTADPKGIILTHRNYTANIEQARRLVDCPAALRAPAHPALGPRLRPHLRHLHR
ncbi:MAG: AMP-binding protein [Candidatus Moduliflexus flocculans]|nr:AMP-binding protein [Candidatus Moduliflexus flocculans]